MEKVDISAWEDFSFSGRLSLNDDWERTYQKELEIFSFCETNGISITRSCKTVEEVLENEPYFIQHDFDFCYILSIPNGKVLKSLFKALKQYKVSFVGNTEFEPPKDNITIEYYSESNSIGQIQIFMNNWVSEKNSELLVEISKV